MAIFIHFLDKRLGLPISDGNSGCCDMAGGIRWRPMKQILLMVGLLALLGCGKKEPVQPSATKPESAEAKTAAGVKLWEFETGDCVWSSPAIGSDGTVYVGSDDHKLYAINGKTGVKIWEFETGDMGRAS